MEPIPHSQFIKTISGAVVPIDVTTSAPETHVYFYKEPDPVQYQNIFIQYGIPGYPYLEPVLPPPVYSQGEDVVFDVTAYVEGQLVTPDKWNVEAILKKNEFAVNVIWKGILNNGLYFKANEGLFQVWVPSEYTSLFLAGTYEVDIVASEYVGQGAGIKERTVILAQPRFGIKYSVGSPHPESSSPLTGKITREGVEPTAPFPYDTVLF